MDFFSGPTVEISPLCGHLEWEQWEWSCHSNWLVQHICCCTTTVREGLCQSVCWEHQRHCSAGETEIHTITLKYHPKPYQRMLCCNSGGQHPSFSSVQPNQWGWVWEGRLGGWGPIWPPLWRHPLLQLLQGLLELDCFPSHSLCFWVWLPVLAFIVHT